MTVNQLIEILQRRAAAGQGDYRVVVPTDGEFPYADDVRCDVLNQDSRLPPNAEPCVLLDFNE